MWKPALFLITIVLVTPNGRELLSEYARRGSSLFAMSSTYVELALIAMALVVVGLLLLMCCQSPSNPDARWIRRVVREEVPGAAVSNRTCSTGRG